MPVYIVALVLSVSMAFLSTRLAPAFTLQLGGRIFTIKRRNIFAFMSFLPLVLVSGLRYNLGVDYNSYAWIFSAITKLNEKTHVEIGYELVNKIIGVFTDNYEVLFMVTSIIILGFFYAAMLKNSAEFYMSVLLFITLGYFFYSMNSVRHFMALAIYLYAFKYMKKQEFAKYLALILLAATMHKIALIAIPLYFVFTQKFKISYYAIIAIFLIIVAVFNKQILNLIFTFVYKSYKNSVYNVYSFSLFNVLLSGVATFFALSYYKPLLKRHKSNIILINAAVFMLLFYLFCGWIPTPTRIGHFGTIYFILLFPEVLACEPNKKVRDFYRIAIILFAIAFLMVMLAGADSPSIGLLPYQSIFSR